MSVNEQTVLMLGVLLVGIPTVLSLGSLIYESILNKREQAKQIEQCCRECCRECCDEMCGCQGCVERERECECCECHDEAECTCKREEECGCCGKPLSECQCNCGCGHCHERD